LAVEGQREEFGGQHCRHCDGVERVSFGNLGDGCMRRKQLHADCIIYTYVENQRMQIDKICFFSLLKFIIRKCKYFNAQIWEV
jgi:hypothetical protein